MYVEKPKRLIIWNGGSTYYGIWLNAKCFYLSQASVYTYSTYLTVDTSDINAEGTQQMYL
jgi:hypothetical protein